jgi:hypothetical protein
MLIMQLLKRSATKFEQSLALLTIIDQLRNTDDMLSAY